MKKILKFLSTLFSKAKRLVENFVRPAVATVENIKKIVDNPLVDIVTGIIPGNIDNYIIEKIRLHLPTVLQILRISDECLKLEKPEEIINCAITKLRLYSPDEKKAAYHSIAAMLSHYMSDKRLSWPEAVHLAQMVYDENKVK